MIEDLKNANVEPSTAAEIVEVLIEDAGKPFRVVMEVVAGICDAGAYVMESLSGVPHVRKNNNKR